MMKLTRQHHLEARLLWQAVTDNGVPNAGRVRLAVQTIRQRVGRNAEAILRCFSRRFDVYLRATRINVVSADPLSPGEQAQLVALGSKAGSLETSVNFTVDPSVIGGLRVERGYQVTDKTIARQLDQLKNLLQNK
ncbi:MAG: F0F1 ATP synthase subunit delta [Kiritimatiellales bacterium]